jgi:TonB family protein
MDQSSGNKQYNAKDIERYHKGQMTAAEMHAIEKAALNDPFLADALEGYTFTSSPQADLEEIRKRLAEKSENRKIIPLYSRTWFRVAAAVMVLGVAGWLIYSGSQQEKNPFADTVARKVLNKDSQDVATATDKKPEANDSTFLHKEIQLSPQNDVVVDAGPPKKTDKRITPPGITGNANEYREVIAERSVNDTASRRDQLNPQAAPNASMKDVSLQPSTRRAFFENDSQNTSDKNAKSTIAGSVKVNDTLKNFNVTMKPTGETVSEVVVTSSGQKKSRTDRYANVVVDTLEPAGGWVKYDDYVANNIRVPEDVRQKEISGVVQLSFDVDKNGLATNIKVEKSLCEECDQEAIRLLKEGPKWNKKKNKKGKLTVRF